MMRARFPIVGHGYSEGVTEVANAFPASLCIEVGP